MNNNLKCKRVRPMCRSTLLVFLMGLFMTFNSITLSAQDNVLKGVIKDAEGIPLIGASVLEQGTQNGAFSDLDGNFSLKLNGKVGEVTVVVSSIGFDDQIIKIVDLKPMDIVLETSSVQLDDVVVVGYGTQKKESVVGAISSAKGSELTKSGGVNSISRALSGLVPGLVTMNTSGKPGQSNADILIRGKSTWNDASPLILVDDVERDMNDIDADEIESISVLKDASATAVFGVRGANGVILITTKRGREGAPKIRFSASGTMKTLSKLPEFAESYEDNWLRNEALEMRLPQNESAWGFYAPHSTMMHFLTGDDPILYPNVDWRHATTKPAWSQRYNMDISGGTKFVKYFASLAYTDEGDILRTEDVGLGFDPRNKYQRLNFRANLDFQLTKTTKFRVDVSGYRGAIGGPGTSRWYFWDGLYGKAPDAYPAVYPDGTPGWDQNNDSNSRNPIASYNYNGSTKKIRTDVITTAQLNQNLDFITKGLSFKGMFTYQARYNSGSSIDFQDTYTKYINPETGDEIWNYPHTHENAMHGFEFVPDIPNVRPEGRPSNVYRNIAYQLSLNYNRHFGKHGVTALAVWKRRETANGDEFTRYREEWAGRITYDYDGRYLFETNMAYNGSEAFGPGYKFGFFPSVAVGWVISNEKFLKNQNWLSFLKIRYSCGKVGSDNGIPRWLYHSSWDKGSGFAGMKWGNTAMGTRPSFGLGGLNVSVYQPYKEGNIANPDAHWETAIKNNIGLEARFFHDALSFNADFYWNTRKDIFMNAQRRNIPPWFGANPVAANLGMTRDHGVDLELKWSDFIGTDFKYFINLSCGIAKNIVVAAEDPELKPAYQKQEGFPIGTPRNTMNGGILKSWDDVYLYPGALDNNAETLPGYYYQVDYNGDGYIDANDNVPAGFGDNPEQMYTIALGFEWKGLSVSANIYGTRNATFINNLLQWSNNAKMGVNKIIVNNCFLPNRPDATMNLPVYKVGQANDGNESLVDGTMWRFKTAEIAYTFQGKALKKAGLSSLRLYINGDNIFLFNHMDVDRERRNKYSNEAMDSMGQYPMTRTFTAGLNLSF